MRVEGKEGLKRFCVNVSAAVRSVSLNETMFLEWK